MKAAYIGKKKLYKIVQNLIQKSIKEQLCPQLKHKNKATKYFVDKIILRKKVTRLVCS